MVQKYKGENGIVEATQWNGSNITDIITLAKNYDFTIESNEISATMVVHTDNGEVRVNKGNYIVKNSDGELSSCNCEEFNNAYVIEH